MELSNTLKMVEEFITRNPMLKPRCIEVLQKDLRSNSRRISAMKTIVSMIQQGYDMSCIHGDVLRIIDTGNYELKLLCNVYLKNTCLSKPGCQLMCINTFLKDFNDQDHRIQALAVSDSVILSDEFLIKNYAKELRRMSSHSSSDIRQLTARSMGLFYMKSRACFEDENMNKYLRLLLNDSDVTVKISVLQSLAIIEKNTKLLATGELLQIANQFYLRNISDALKEVLNVLKYRELTEEMKLLYLKLLSHSDICIFYLSASKLLQEKMHINKIYDECLSFMNCRSEKLYNLLLFVETFVHEVTIDVKDFYFLSSEPDYIKMIKIRILLKKLDQMSLSEKLKVVEMVDNMIAKGNKLAIETIKSVLKSSLEYDINLNSIVDSDDVVSLLFDIKARINKKHIHAVSSFIYKIKDTQEAEKLIELALLFCSKIPSFIFNLDKLEDIRPVVKFFLGFRDKKLISDNQCIVYLKNLARKHPMDRYLNLALSSLIKNDSQVTIIQIPSNLDIITEKVDFEYNLSQNNDVLANKPFLPNSEKEAECNLYSSETTQSNSTMFANLRHGSELNLNDFVGNNINEETAGINKTQKLDFSCKNPEPGQTPSPIYLVFEGFCGVLMLEDNLVVLKVQQIDKSHLIDYSIRGVNHQQLIEKAGKFVLFEINEHLVNERLDLKINEEKRSIPLKIIK